MNASTPDHRPGWLPAAPGGHGVTDTIIQVGVLDADADAAFAATNAATGGRAQSGSFSFREANLAAIDAVNSLGGIAGREVQPVFYRAQAAAYFSASARQRSEEQRCAHFTEDNQVFAFGGNGTDIMVRCAVRTKTPWIPSGYHLRLTHEHARSIAGYYYEVADLAADRSNRALARFLQAHGFFSGQSKVGLMVEDLPDSVQGAQAMKPVLTAAGAAPAVEIRYPDPVESPWSNYVLQLQSAGVTNVVWAAQSQQVLPAVFMMQAAENQRYRPKWGFGSDMTLVGLSNFGAPPDQLANVLAMGWQPVVDTANVSAEAVDARSASVCDEHLKKRGQLDGATGTTYGRQQCEWLFLLRAAFAGTNELSPAGLAAGIAALGDRYGSVLTIGGRTSFGPGRHDGVTMVRPVAYDRGGNTFKCIGDLEPVPR